MANCPFCESTEAPIQDLGELTRVRWPQCQEYRLANTLLTQLPSDPEWPQLRLNLSRFVRSWFLRQRRQPIDILESDGLKFYERLDAEYLHQFVDHAVEYVKGHVHTNHEHGDPGHFRHVVPGALASGSRING